MNIVGLDLSIAGSGGTKFYLDDNFNIIDKQFIAFSQVKKNSLTSEEGSIYYYKKKDFSNYIEKNTWMTEKISDFIMTAKTDYVAIEDYAFAATGQVYHIGEFVGGVKRRIYNEGIPMRLYEPTTIKKFVVRGNADKVLMEEMYEKEEHKFSATDNLPGRGKSPKGDIIDSYFCAKLLLLELQVRNGIKTVKNDLTKKEIEIFNRTSKKNPENLLCREFLV